MTASGRYDLYMAKLDADVMDQVLSSGVTPNVQSERVTPVGNMDPSGTLLFGDSPGIRFVSTKVNTILTALGSQGALASSQFDLGFIQKTVGGGYEATGKTVTAAKALVFPESLVVTQDSKAQLTVMAMAYSSDGTTHPFASSTSLVSGTPEATEFFTLGAVTIDGSPISKVNGYTINFGINAQTLKTGGNLYPTDAIVESPVMPAIEVQVSDLAAVTDANLVGREVDNVVLNLKKLDVDGSGLASSGHKTFTLAKAMLTIGGASGSFPGEAGATINFAPRSDSGAAVIAIA